MATKTADPTIADLMKVIADLNSKIDALSQPAVARGEAVDLRGRYYCPDEFLFIGRLDQAQDHKDTNAHVVVDRHQGVRI